MAPRLPPPLLPSRTHSPALSPLRSPLSVLEPFDRTLDRASPRGAIDVKVGPSFGGEEGPLFWKNARIGDARPHVLNSPNLIGNCPLTPSPPLKTI